MAYNGFAYWYDQLNTDADYNLLEAKLAAILAENGITGGIVADLGCGTGEVSLRLAQRGYEMIAVDSSPDMLTIFREKCRENAGEDILLLNQPLQELDLYGTIHAAVSTFDTFNHLQHAELGEAIRRIALFMEPGGVLVFDINTPYKHRAILADNSFELETEDGLVCYWDNRLDEGGQYTEINLEIFQGNDCVCNENFREYIYNLDDIRNILEQNHFKILEILDGENFGKPGSESQRLLVTAKRGIE